MAKINARGARRIGPTLFTEKTRPADQYDGARVYREAWRLRSDGVVQTRIVRTWPAPGAEGHLTEHSSGFRNLGRLAGTADREADIADWQRLRDNLERKGYTIIEESWR